MGGQAARIGLEAPQEVEALLAPQPDLDEVVHATQCGARDQQQDFGQRVDHAPAPVRSGQGGEVVEDRQRGRHRRLTGGKPPRDSQDAHPAIQGLLTLKRSP